MIYAFLFTINNTHSRLPLTTLLSFLHARLVQQPFNLPPHNPYDVALGPNSVRVGLAPPLNGTHGVQDPLHRVEVGRQPAAREELLVIIGAPLLAEEDGLVEVGDGRRQRPR